MRLVELGPFFVTYGVGVASPHIGQPQPDGTTKWGGFPVKLITHVDSLVQAQGIWFLCPLCFTKNNGPVGTHMIDVTFAGRGVPDDHGSHGDGGAPARWQVSGTGFEDLTTTPSILLIGGCNWHGFITQGMIA